MKWTATARVHRPRVFIFASSSSIPATAFPKLSTQTGMCAARLRLRDRGLVREGYAADLAVFDPRVIRDESTFADPHRYPSGIPYVVVNGAVVVDGGRMKPLGTGRVLTP